MADLLRNQCRFAGSVSPRPQEEFSKEGIQGLFLISKLLASAGILVLESRQKPFQNKEGAFGRVRLRCGSNKDGRMCCPIGGEFC